jgi:hypothetical protein
MLAYICKRWWLIAMRLPLLGVDIMLDFKAQVQVRSS